MDCGRLQMLVVTADPVESHGDDEQIRDLIGSLSDQSRYAELTVLLTERPLSLGHVRSWLSADARLVVGPPDPGAAMGAEWGRYSHVVVTNTGARSRALEWVEVSQPQASRVLFLPSLEFLEVEALAAATSADDLAGLLFEGVVTREHLGRWVAWADSVWCTHPAHAGFVAGGWPAKGLSLIPPAISVAGERPPREHRRGVVIGAIDGYRVTSGVEDAAVTALERVLPRLRTRHVGLECTVVSDRPSPMLEAAAAAVGARLVCVSALAGAIADARLVLAASSYGTGQRHLLVTSLRQGTPFVATPASLGGLQLGELAQLAVRDDEASCAALCLQLLSDDDRWELAVEAGDRMVSQHSPAVRAEAVRKALQPLGIRASAPVIRRTSEGARPKASRASSARPAVSLRPRQPAEPPPPEETVPASNDGRYRIWVRRFGPNPDVLASLREDLADLRGGPKFSVLMPVHNTDADLLLSAVESVQAQIYENWELCVANDGSTRGETLRTLDALRNAEGVKVVDLETQSGIAAATNAALSLAEGDFVAFLDHDDVLKPHALAQVARWLRADPSLDVVYSDEDKLDPQGDLVDLHLKPDWSPDQLMSQNYVCHLTVARRSVVDAVGGLRPAYDGSQDYDLLLRLTERTDRIGHVPEPLYSWRVVPGSFAADEASKPYAVVAGERALADALRRRGYDGRVETVASSGRYRVHYPLPGRPNVAVVIPTRDRLDLLSRCIDSVIERTTYDNYQIVIIDNQSADAATLEYLARQPWEVVRYPHAFNYARMINLAAHVIECDALLFLNNDTEVITPEWMEALLEHAMRPEVGIVGARLYFGDGRVQHEGIMVGAWGGWATNIDHRGYFQRGEFIRNTSAVTGACSMIRPSVYWRVGGSDDRLRVAYNDVDLCLRIRQAGYRVVYTPYAELFHNEGSSRLNYQHNEDGPRFGARWDPYKRIDPYYSPIFSNEVPFEVQV